MSSPVPSSSLGQPTLSVTASSSPAQPSLPVSAYEVEEIVTTVRVPVVRPKPAFLRVLRLSGGMGETYTMSEIIELVSSYVEDRKLYDEANPRFVYCKNDPLGEALNVPSFVVNEEVVKLFWENCHMTPDSCLRIKRDLVTRPVSSESSLTDRRVSGQQTCGEGYRTRTSGIQAPRAINQTRTPTAPINAVPPSTSVTQSDIEEYEETQVGQIPENSLQKPVESTDDAAKPSASQSAGCDETDGPASPWSCQVTVERHVPSPRQRVRNHDSLVVECTSDTFSVEYELVSSSDAEPTADVVGDESEGSTSSQEATEVLVVCQESDIEYLADYSDSDSDSDAELSSEDKWHCQQCKFKNSALYRNCEKCWGIRPDWLPAPSTSGACERKDAQGGKHSGGDSGAILEDPSLEAKAADACRGEQLSATSLGDPCPAEEDGACELLDVHASQDSAICSQISSQEHIVDGAAAALNDTNTSAVNSSESKKSFEEKKEMAKGVSQILKRKDESDWSDLDGENDAKKLKRERGIDLKSSDPCMICLTRSKTASIIHGKTGHQVCCYRCAKQLKQQRKSCPICRRPIQKVIRNFF